MAKKFDEEYRREAVTLVVEGGIAVWRAAKDLGVGQSPPNQMDSDV